MAHSHPENEPQSPESRDGIALCPGSLAPLAERADFCDKYGMPVSSFATLDPLKHIYAQGWACAFGSS